MMLRPRPIRMTLVDCLQPPHVHIVILSSASKIILRIKSSVNFLFLSLSALSLLSNPGPNANGAEVLGLVEEEDIIRLIFAMNAINNADNTFSMT